MYARKPTYHSTPNSPGAQPMSLGSDAPAACVTRATTSAAIHPPSNSRHTSRHGADDTPFATRPPTPTGT